MVSFFKVLSPPGLDLSVRVARVALRLGAVYRSEEAAVALVRGISNFEKGKKQSDAFPGAYHLGSFGSAQIGRSFVGFEINRVARF
jgi:hypothetical protein